MKMPSPFSWWSPGAQKLAFALLTPLAILCAFIMTQIGQPLVEAGANIVEFELAGTLSSAQAILQMWRGEGQLYAALSLGLDYLFLLLYGSAISLGCVLVTRFLQDRVRWLATIGSWLAWGMIAAALLDAIENAALIRLLLGGQESWLAPVARWCALPKFGLVFLGLIYVLLVGIPGLLLSLRQRLTT
jgi:hypothetical protein